MTSLLELRDALRKATGYDRRCNIELALLFAPIWQQSGAKIERQNWRNILDALDKHGVTMNSWRHVNDFPINVPNYTASIDSAVTLVPSDGSAIWTVYNDWPGDVFWAKIELDRGVWDLPREYKSSCCPSPALALCLARVEHEIALQEGASP